MDQEKITINVIECKNLPTANNFGTGAEPHVELTMGDQVVQTETYKKDSDNGLNPEFNQTFTFNFPKSSNPDLIVKVLDENKGIIPGAAISYDLMCEKTINYEDLINGKHTIDLENSDGTPCGATIILEFTKEAIQPVVDIENRSKFETIVKEEDPVKEAAAAKGKAAAVEAAEYDETHGDTTEDEEMQQFIRDFDPSKLGTNAKEATPSRLSAAVAAKLGEDGRARGVDDITRVGRRLENTLSSSIPPENKTRKAAKKTENSSSGSGTRKASRMEGVAARSKALFGSWSPHARRAASDGSQAGNSLKDPNIKPKIYTLLKLAIINKKINDNISLIDFDEYKFIYQLINMFIQKFYQQGDFKLDENLRKLALVLAQKKFEQDKDKSGPAVTKLSNYPQEGSSEELSWPELVHDELGDDELDFFRTRPPTPEPEPEPVFADEADRVAAVERAEADEAVIAADEAARAAAAAEADEAARAAAALTNAPRSDGALVKALADKPAAEAAAADKPAAEAAAVQQILGGGYKKGSQKNTKKYKK